MAVTLAGSQGGFALTGRAPALTATNAVASLGGLPVSWTALAAGAVGAATPRMQWMQARFVVTGQFGNYGSLVIDGSPDNVNWTPLAGLNDPLLPGYGLNSGYGGLKIFTPGNGLVILAITDPNTAPLRFLRPRVVSGDGLTLLAVAGNINPVGAV
jgi:hypothetical protein